MGSYSNNTQFKASFIAGIVSGMTLSSLPTASAHLDEYWVLKRPVLSNLLYLSDGTDWVKVSGGSTGISNGLVGTKSVSEADIADNRILVYNGTELMYVAREDTFERMSKNLSSAGFSIFRTAGVITTIDYNNGIRKGINRTAGEVTSVVLSLIATNTVIATKTITRTAGSITAMAYSAP